MNRLEQNYTFNKSTNQVTFLDLTQTNNPLVLSRIKLITDTTVGIIIYQFNNSSLGGTVSGNVLTLTYNCSALSNSDSLQIIYDFPYEDNYDVLPNAINASTAISSIGAGVSLDNSGFNSLTIQLTGAWTGVITIESSTDNTNWFDNQIIDSRSLPLDWISENGIYTVQISGQYLRYNVKEITGTANMDIDGRSSGGGLRGADSLALAMDKANNTPLNVALPINLKQDIQGALIPSDSIMYQFNSASATQMIIDTTGYETIVLHQQTSGVITPTTSNDGINWVNIVGYPSTMPSSLISATSGAGITIWAVSGKYFNLTGSANNINAIIYLRQAPFEMPFPVAGDNYNILPTTPFASSAITIVGAGTNLDTTGFVTVSIQVSGAWTGYMGIETSTDNINWFDCPTNDNKSLPVDYITDNGIYVIPILGRYIRYNVKEITGTINVDIDGRSTAGGLRGADTIAYAMDKNLNMPLNVALPVNLKQDAQGALIFSDNIMFVFNSTVATTPMIIDTTGYESIVLHQTTTGIITPTASNDGINWYGISGYLSSAPSTALAATAGAGLHSFPVLGRFLKITGPASIVNAIIYLRTSPFVSSSTSAVVNMTQFGSYNVVTGGVNGLLAVGGNVAVGSAPTANPIPLAIDTSGLTRRLLTDTGGRLVQAATSQDQVARTLNTVNNTFENGTGLQVQDISQTEGQTNGELFLQILNELKIISRLLAELPYRLQHGIDFVEDVENMRLDSSFFINN